jgi:sugar O-acyltransferase (sialic acid O-acetyltransferase NeuD family)
VKLLIIGGGGHAKVVADVAIAQACYESIVFVDDQYPTLARVLDFPVLGTSSQLAEIVAREDITSVFIAIGNNKKRFALLQQCQSLGLNLPNLIHPSAVISRFAKLGNGILVMPNAVINCAAVINDGCIINTAAIIEHDCTLESAVHVSPNAALAGKVYIGQCSWIGIGAAIKEQVNVGQNVIVGAGSVVINDLSDNQIVVGVPAKLVKYTQNE